MKNTMIHSEEELRSRYRFSDFLFYTCLLAVPLLTAVLAILRHSVGWMVVYLVLLVAASVLLLKFFCSRCPHYTREEKSLKCIFFWGMPKFFPPRPGPLQMMDKAASILAAALLLGFPLYWLVQEPGLLIVFALSTAGFAAAVRRNECRRCIYLDCPANAVPDSLKHPE
jgi:hypothetical protein